MCVKETSKVDFSNTVIGPRGFVDLWRREIYFRELGSTGYFFQGSGEQAYSFRD